MTTIFINNNPVTLPEDYMTLSDLVKWRDLNPNGTAIAIGDKIISKDKWPVTKLENHMEVTVITAAFGG